MAKSKDVKQVFGIDAVVAEASGAAGRAASTQNSGRHVPKWLVYGGIGFCALAAAYLGFRLVTAVPEAKPDQRATPPAVATPYRQPTPAVSQYQKQALEEIALIGQKEPGLASLLQKTDWLSDGVTPGEANFVAKIRSYIVQGNYSTGTISSNESPLTTILVTGSDKIKREESLVITRQYLPRVSQLLKIEYKKPLLIIDIFQGGGGGGFRNVTVTNPDDLEHELVHTVFETSGPEASPLAQIPGWLGEGVPDFVLRYLKGGDVLVEIARKNLNNPSRGIIEPLYEISLVPGRLSPSVYDGGLLFLAEYKKLVGYDNFWDAMRQVHDWRVVQGTVKRKVIYDKDLANPTQETKDAMRKLHEDIRSILEQHTPKGKEAEFNRLYNFRVYGQQSPP